MKINREPSLCEELPYWEFVSEPVPHVVHIDGTLVVGLKSSLLDIECFDNQKINDLTVQLRSCLESLSEDSDVQFCLNIESDFEKTISHHESRIEESSHSLIVALEKERMARLREEMKDCTLYRPRLHVYVSKQMEQSQKLKFLSSRKSFVNVSEETYRTTLEELSQQMMSFKLQLEGLGLTVTSLSMDETLDHIYQTLNPKRSFVMPRPEMPVTSLSVESSDATLGVRVQSPTGHSSSPRERLTFGDLVLDQEEFLLDQRLHRVITLKTLPEMTYAGMLASFLRLPFHYDLVLSVSVPEQIKEMSKLNQKRRMAHSLSISQDGRASDLESESKLSSTEELIRELLNSGQRIYQTHLMIVLKAENSKSGVRELNLKTKEVLSRLRGLQGAEGCQETVGSWKVFKNQLPAAAKEMIRPKKMKTSNLADFLPVYGPRLGDADPVVLFHNRLHGLVSFNPYDSGLPNYNALVTGSSGAGKSFFNNFILLQQMARNSRVFIIDIGGSYRKLTTALGGQYIEMNLSDRYAINPFDLSGDTAPSSQKLKSLVSIVEQMVSDDDKSKLSKLDRVLIEKEILDVYDNCKGATPCLSDLMTRCLESPEPGLNTIGKLLFSWTGARPFGQLLDRPGKLQTEAKICAFDLKGLSSYPDLQSVMILILTDFILTQVEKDKTSTKRIILDEAWELLKSEAASSFMEYCARTLRKTGSGITFITQGVEEIVASPIGSAILNNTATKVVMLQRGDTKILSETLKLNSEELTLVQGLRSQKGEYSEALLIEGNDRQVIRIFPMPLDYWLSTSDSKDNAALEKIMRDENLDLTEALKVAAKRMPFGVAYADNHKTEVL